MEVLPDDPVGVGLTKEQSELVIRSLFLLKIKKKSRQSYMKGNLEKHNVNLETHNMKLENHKIKLENHNMKL
jgi:hypothetical protein